MITENFKCFPCWQVEDTNWIFSRNKSVTFLLNEFVLACSPALWRQNSRARPPVVTQDPTEKLQREAISKFLCWMDRNFTWAINFPFPFKHVYQNTSKGWAVIWGAWIILQPGAWQQFKWGVWKQLKWGAWYQFKWGAWQYFKLGEWEKFKWGAWQQF